MLAVCSHNNLLPANRAFLFGVCMPRPSHYGENAHHMEEIPERRGPAADKLSGLSKGSAGRSPAEVKRAMHPDYAKREAKKAKSKNKGQT
jgi:hypothetical protein